MSPSLLLAQIGRLRGHVEEHQLFGFWNASEPDLLIEAVGVEGRQHDTTKTHRSQSGNDGSGQEEADPSTAIASFEM